jgi:hypothetical protein
MIVYNRKEGHHRELKPGEMITSTEIRYNPATSINIPIFAFFASIF